MGKNTKSIEPTYEETRLKKYSNKYVLDNTRSSKHSNVSGPAAKQRKTSDKSSVSNVNNKKTSKINSSKLAIKRILLLTFLPISLIIKNISKIMKGKTNMKNTKQKPESKEVSTTEVPKVPKWHGILGIGLALVIVSIAYSTVVIYLGTDGLLPKVMLAPQVIFAASVLVIAFSKIFK